MHIAHPSIRSSQSSEMPSIVQCTLGTTALTFGNVATEDADSGNKVTTDSCTVAKNYEQVMFIWKDAKECWQEEDAVFGDGVRDDCICPMSTPHLMLENNNEHFSAHLVFLHSV